MVARWDKLVEETGDYTEQLYYCKARVMYCFEIIRFGVFMTHSSIIKDEKLRKNAVREVIVL
jgi:hypothetical protein